MSVKICVCVCIIVYMGRSGQLVGDSSLLLPCGSRGHTQVIRRLHLPAHKLYSLFFSAGEQNPELGESRHNPFPKSSHLNVTSE